MTDPVGISPAKNLFAGVVAAMFVFALGYQVFNYFSNLSKTPATKPESEDIISGSTKRADNEQKESTAPVTPTSIDNRPDDVTASQDLAWQANDYKQGDIKNGSYTVRSGDTLWEIADGVYGDGGRWVEILDANASDVGFLPNGVQALILPGQQLTL